MLPPSCHSCSPPGSQSVASPMLTSVKDGGNFTGCQKSVCCLTGVSNLPAKLIYFTNVQRAHPSRWVVLFDSGRRPKSKPPPEVRRGSAGGRGPAGHEVRERAALQSRARRLREGAAGDGTWAVWPAVLAGLGRGCGARPGSVPGPQREARAHRRRSSGALAVPDSRRLAGAKRKSICGPEKGRERRRRRCH